MKSRRYEESPYRKTKIPKALREQVWLKCIGERFDSKCKVVWCKNRINVFDFQCGHNIPESKGGQTTLDNLLPICSRCNISMGSQYTIDEWNAKFRSSRLNWFQRLFGKRNANTPAGTRV